MPSILTHPLAPAAQAPAAVGNTPKYLVRSDGMVTVYTAALAKLPGFTPTDVLPAAHVAATRAAAQRDAVALQARQAHQVRMEALESARRERVAAGKGGVLAGGVVAAEGATAVATPVAAAAVAGAPVGKAVVASTAVVPVVPALDIGSADKAALKAFFAQHGVKTDLRRPVEELRAVAHEAARKGRAGGGA